MNSVQLHSCTVASKFTKFCSKKSTSTKDGIHSSIDDVDSVHLGLSENPAGQASFHCQLFIGDLLMFHALLPMLIGFMPAQGAAKPDTTVGEVLHSRHLTASISTCEILACKASNWWGFTNSKPTFHGFRSFHSFYLQL